MGRGQVAGGNCSVGSSPDPFCPPGTGTELGLGGGTATLSEASTTTCGTRARLGQPGNSSGSHSAPRGKLIYTVVAHVGETTPAPAAVVVGGWVGWEGAVLPPPPLPAPPPLSISPGGRPPLTPVRARPRSPGRPPPPPTGTRSQRGPGPGGLTSSRLLI